MQRLVKILVGVLFFLCGLCAHGEQLKLDLPPEVITQIARGYGGKTFERLAPEIQDFTKWEREDYNFGVTVLCFSDHRTGASKNLYNERNDCVGLTLFLPWKIVKATISLEYRHIGRNSVNGTSESRGIGVGWHIIQGNFDLSGGFKYAHIKYYDPGTLVRIRKPASTTGEAILPYLELSHEAFSFVVEPLGKNATIGSIMLKGKIGWFF